MPNLHVITGALKDSYVLVSDGVKVCKIPYDATLDEAIALLEASDLTEEAKVTSPVHRMLTADLGEAGFYDKQLGIPHKVVREDRPWLDRGKSKKERRHG